MNNFILFIFCIQLTIFSFSQEKGLQIDYTLEEITQKAPNALDRSSAPPTDKSIENFRIQLKENGWFSTFSENSGNLRFDFGQKLIFKENADTLFSIIPLHSIIDYRISEYKNRKLLSMMMQVSTTENPFEDFLSLESLFGIEDVQNNYKDSIQSTVIDGNEVFSMGETELVKVRFSKIKIAPSHLDAFSKFLLYQTTIHPSIQRKIIEKQFVPEFLEYSSKNVGTTTIKTYTLITAKTTTIKPILKDDPVMFQRNSTPLSGLIDSLTNYTFNNDIEMLDSNFYFKEANQLAENEENLSALLALFEYLLSTGHQPTPQIEQIIPKQFMDPELSSLIDCMNPPRSSEESQQKIILFNSLIALDKKYGYVMNIFAANYIASTDQSKCKDYYYEALSKRPEITGGWRDLGKIYEEEYNFTDAWKCYAIMLKMNDQHGMAQEIIRKKNTLEMNYPMYFM